MTQGSTPLRWRCGLCKHTARKNHIYEHWGLHAEVTPYLDSVHLVPAKPKPRAAAAAASGSDSETASDGADGLMELAFAVLGQGTTAHVSAALPVETLPPPPYAHPCECGSA